MPLLQLRGQEIMLQVHDILNLLVHGLLNQPVSVSCCLQVVFLSLCSGKNFWGMPVHFALRQLFGTYWFPGGELFKFIALCVAIMSLFLAFGQCEFSCVAAVISGLHQLSEFVSRYWKSEFCMHHLCSCYVGHLSARLLISSHLAVRSQNNLMGI